MNIHPTLHVSQQWRLHPPIQADRSLSIYRRPPRPGDIIDYIWDDTCHPPVYRTGIVCKSATKRSKQYVRFFRREEYYCDLTKTAYTTNRFYFRPDVTERATCYDVNRRKWCIITRIDKRNAGVYVLYEHSSSPQLISPDFLVGITTTQANPA